MDCRQILLALLCCLLCCCKGSFAIKCFVCSPDHTKRINCMKITSEHIVDCPHDEKQCYAIMAGNSGDADGSVQRDCGEPPALAFLSGSMGTGCRVIGGTSTICSCATDLCNDVGNREQAEIIREETLPDYKSERDMSKLPQTAPRAKEDPTLAVETPKDSATTTTAATSILPSTVLFLSLFVALFNNFCSSSCSCSPSVSSSLPRNLPCSEKSQFLSAFFASDHRRRVADEVYRQRPIMER